MNIYKNLSIKSLPSEKWKWIPGYEKLYKVSSMGRIKSVPRKRIGGRPGKISERIRKQCLKNGYLTVSLFKNKRPHFHTVHILVGRMFIPNPVNKKEVNHKKGNKFDCRASELEWATPSENVLHAYSIGLKVGMNGEKHPFSKLTNKQAVSVFNSADSIPNLAKRFNVAKSVIYCIKNGRAYSTVTGKKRVEVKSRITPETALSIFNEPGVYSKVAEKYNVSRYSVKAIKNGRNWGWVTKGLKLFDNIYKELTNG